MISDKQGQHLHHLMTTGQQLSPEEQANLQTWYVEQDNTESQEISIVNSNVREKIQIQIEHTLNQLIELSNKIQLMITENNKIRQKNAELEKRVEELFTSKVA